MNSLSIALLILAALTIAVLVALAWRLWRKVWQQEAALASQRDAALQAEVERIKYVNDSLNVIAQCVLDGQVRIAEAGIRMAVLLDQLPLSCDVKHRCAPVFELYQQTRHIPTHSAWNALEKPQRRAYEKELAQVETQHEKAVLEVSAWIAQNPFGKQTGELH